MILVENFNKIAVFNTFEGSQLFQQFSLIDSWKRIWTRYLREERFCVASYLENWTSVKRWLYPLQPTWTIPSSSSLASNQQARPGSRTRLVEKSNVSNRWKWINKVTFSLVVFILYHHIPVMRRFGLKENLCSWFSVEPTLKKMQMTKMMMMVHLGGQPTSTRGRIWAVKRAVSLFRSIRNRDQAGILFFWPNLFVRVLSSSERELNTDRKWQENQASVKRSLFLLMGKKGEENWICEKCDSYAESISSVNQDS